MSVRLRTLILFGVGLVIGLAEAGSGLAQFEEPDTVGRFGVGVFVELNFRGDRGTSGQNTISFGGGPSIGPRLEFRATDQLTLAALGSFARVEERLEAAGGTATSPDKITIFQFGGELLLRVKPGIPGFFVLGGGIRSLNPDAEEGSPTQITQAESFSEPYAEFGAGVELAPRRHTAFRLDLRLYFVSPNDDPNYEDTKSVEIDFAVGGGFVYKF